MKVKFRSLEQKWALPSHKSKVTCTQQSPNRLWLLLGQNGSSRLWERQMQISMTSKS